MENASKPRFLCVLAMPRTGSSLLNYLLSTIPEMTAKSELFHAHYQAKFSPEEHAALSKRSGLDQTDNAEFTAWKRAHPAATLDALHEGNGGRGIVTFKVFPGHVKTDLLESEIMARGDTVFAILRRRPIESFISNEKANTVGKFTKHDTTDMKPELSAEAFLKLARRTWRWYRWCETALEAHGKRPVRIAYERDLNHRSGIEAVHHIVALLAPLQLGALSDPEELNERGRQDREPRYQDRVANWPAFEAAVRARPDGAKLLDWAERSR